MNAASESIDARIPLAVLAAMQQQDIPPELQPDEHPGSMFPQRLGLSGVIEEQVRELRRLARSGRGVEPAKVEALLALVARRHDAAEIFSAAGSELARLHFSGFSGSLHRFKRRLPRALRQRAAAKALRKASGSFLVATDVEVRRKPLEIRATDALTSRIGQYGAACKLYTSLASDLLARLGMGSMSVIHSDCQRLGAPQCVWHVEEIGSDGRPA